MLFSLIISIELGMRKLLETDDYLSYDQSMGYSLLDVTHRLDTSFVYKVQTRWTQWDVPGLSTHGLRPHSWFQVTGRVTRGVLHPWRRPWGTRWHGVGRPPPSSQGWGTGSSVSPVPAAPPTMECFSAAETPRLSLVQQRPPTHSTTANSL